MTAPALPVLAVARTGLRRVSLVVLDRRLRVRSARTLDLRKRSGVANRLAVVEAALLRVVHRDHVAALVLEAETTRSRTPPGFRDLVRRVCDDDGVWLQERTVASALRQIDDGAPKEAVVVEIATKYRELASRLDFRRPSLFRDRDHERDARPLVNAFILAHAMSLEARLLSPKATATERSTRVAA